MIKVSVIMPTYNCAQYICEAIESVLCQTFQNFEIIIVDDGSLDNTKELVSNYIRKGNWKIKYFFQQNLGPAAARNKAINESSGEYIAFLDADDLWLPEKLEKSLVFIEKNNFDWICTACEKVYEVNEQRESKRLADWVYNHNTKEIRLLKQGICFFPIIDLFTITVVLKRRCFEKVGLFDESYLIAEDHDLWLRLEEAGFRAGYLEKTLSVYKHNKKSLTKGKKIDALKYALKVCRKHSLVLGLSNKLVRQSYAEFLWQIGVRYYLDKKYILTLNCIVKSIYYNYLNLLRSFRLINHHKKTNIKTRILLLTKIFPPKIGGIPNYYWNLVNNIKNINVTILTGVLEKSQYYDDLLQQKGIEVVRVRGFPSEYGIRYSLSWVVCLFRIVFEIMKEVLSKKIDYIVVGQAEFFQSLSAYIASFFTHKPYLLFLHNEEVPELKFKSNFILKHIFRKSFAYFCNSEFTLKKLVKFIAKKIHPVIITPGVEDIFFEHHDSSSLKKALGLENKNIIYTIARLDERKGHDAVIESLPLVLGSFPNTVYLICGNGLRFEYLQDLVSKRGLTKHVKFLGEVPQEKIVLYHCLGDIFIMPNRTLKGGDTEGFGIVFLEANAVGNPVIGGRSGGAQNAIIDGITGFLVEPEDKKDIAEKVIRLLDNKEMAKSMGQKGRERCWNEFRWPKRSDKFEESFFDIINHSNSFFLGE